MSNDNVDPSTVAAFGRLWTAVEVAEFLGVPVATLHRWRYLGTGPAAYRVGRHLRYDPQLVRVWLRDECARAAG